MNAVTSASSAGAALAPGLSFDDVLQQLSGGRAPGTTAGSGASRAATGRTITIAQLALASFNNPQGLVKLGSNRFGESEGSGIPNIGTASTGGRGSIFGGALEQSNVDIAQEFTQMILAQRGYQANSKSITVADEVLQDTLALKR